MHGKEWCVHRAGARCGATQMCLLTHTTPWPLLACAWLFPSPSTRHDMWKCARGSVHHQLWHRGMGCMMGIHRFSQLLERPLQRGIQGDGWCEKGCDVAH
ncbi:hypothetical protein TRVL_07028 [Trypanosoma vivax]|nr:hypothetical protein TRVL_07028 [Trypanosoma vivax]